MTDKERINTLRSMVAKSGIAETLSCLAKVCRDISDCEDGYGHITNADGWCTIASRLDSIIDRIPDGVNYYRG